MLERIKNYWRHLIIKRDEAIDTCIEVGIPLTDKNINEVREILKNAEDNYNHHTHT